MSQYFLYWGRMIRFLFVGGKVFYSWVATLLLLFLVGVVAYSIQLSEGLITSNMSDQVSWGAYIANFTFLVGVAAAAVLLAVPTYLYHRTDVKEVVLLGELLAVAAIIMCLLFVVVDLGRPDRFLHILPFTGRLNFPQSILAWDVAVLNGYLVLNLHIPGYLLYKKYKGEEARPGLYLPFVFISIVWAVSIHTVTAFLYSGLGGRPFWNSAILAPRFLVSAFASGPALMILIFAIINHFTKFKIQKSVTDLLVQIIKFALPLNLFLLGCEVFKEFYTDSAHTASAEYLFFGLHGHGMLTPFIWTSIFFSVTSITVFALPALRKDPRILWGACVLTVVGIWVEKGMGLIIPGFIPTPLGDLVQYTPSIIEILVCLGIWSLGALLFTLMAKVAIAIQSGTLRMGKVKKRA